MAHSYLVDRRNIHTTPWTTERDALLARLWAEGYSASQIADAIMDVDVSRCAVIGRAHRLKLPARAARQPAVRKPYKRRMSSVPKPPAPSPRPKPPPPPPPDMPRMRRLPLLELKPTSCRWPIGEGPFLFCGVDKAEGETYCLFHQRIARVREKTK